MRVLIVGFYGVMNAGDDLLQQSLAWLFREHRLTFSHGLPRQDVIHQFDLLIVGGGSLWPQHPFFQLGASYAKDLRIPYMVLGVSARNYDPIVARLTRPLIERAVIFHVRDSKTANWLDHPGVYHGSDLFWTAPWAGDAEVSKIPTEGVAIAPRSDALAEWPMADIIDACSELGPIHGWPFFYGDSRHDRGGLNDFEAIQSAIPDTPHSFSLQPLRSSRIVFTMRYHGLLCSVRAGRPALVGDVHVKLGSFCQQYGLTSWQIDGINDLKDQALAMANNFDTQRKIALALRTELLAEGRALASRIRQKTKEIPERRISAARKFFIGGVRSVLGKIS